MSTFETWDLVATAAAPVVSAIAIGFLVWQIAILRHQVSDAKGSYDATRNEVMAENKRLRELSTLEFIASTRAHQASLYDRIPPAGSHRHRAFLKKASRRESREFMLLRNYLNFLENFAVGVNMGIYDIVVVRRTDGSRIVRAWHLYRLWIEEERSVLQLPMIFKEIEILAVNLEAMSYPSLLPSQRSI